jgi:hypothetical protein
MLSQKSNVDICDLDSMSRPVHAVGPLKWLGIEWGSGWLVVEVVFSFQDGVIYIVSFCFYILSMKFENFYPVTKQLFCGHNVVTGFMHFAALSPDSF